MIQLDTPAGSGRLASEPGPRGTGARRVAMRQSFPTTIEAGHASN